MKVVRGRERREGKRRTQAYRTSGSERAEERRDRGRSVPSNFFICFSFSRFAFFAKYLGEARQENEAGGEDGDEESNVRVRTWVSEERSNAREKERGKREKLSRERDRGERERERERREREPHCASSCLNSASAAESSRSVVMIRSRRIPMHG